MESIERGALGADRSRGLESTANPHQCRLLSGPFADFIQLSLAVMALGALTLKRYQESPQRPWRIWSMDVSKQCLGNLLAHFENMLLAMILASVSGGGDQCAWYFVNYLVDSSLGMILDISIIKILECWASRQPINSWPRIYIAQSGNYGNPPIWRIWFWQTMVWLGVVTGAKFGLLFFLLAYDKQFSYWGHWIFKPLANYPQAELVIVMVVVPGITNVLQFWVLDTVLKSSAPDTTSIISPDKAHYKVSYEPIDESIGGGPLDGPLTTSSSLSSSGGSRRTADRRGVIARSRRTGGGATAGSSWFRPWSWTWGVASGLPSSSASNSSIGRTGRGGSRELALGLTSNAFYQPPDSGSSSAAAIGSSGGVSRTSVARGALEPAWLSNNMQRLGPYADSDETVL